MEVYQDSNGLWHADGVPLIETGVSYPAETGPITFTQEMIEDIFLGITQDPAILNPRIKLGHGSGYNKALVGDAEQAFGRVENIQLENNNQRIIGDYIAPEWLAKVLPYAYPSRSIEGNHDVVTSTGRQYTFVMTSVSLLGVRWPGCEVLEDLPLWYGDEIPAGVEMDDSISAAAIQSGSVTRMKLPTVRAAVDTSQIRRKFYATAMSGDLDVEEGVDTYWWYIRGEKYDNKDGMYLIADDEAEGLLYKIPVNVKKNEVSFGTPVEVVEEFPEKTAAARAAVVAGIASAERARGLEFAVHASRADTCPEGTTTQEGASTMDDATRKSWAVKLGLSEDASETDVTSKIEKLVADETSGQQGAADLAPAADAHGTTGPSPEPSRREDAPTASGPVVTPPKVEEKKDEPDTEAGYVRIDRDTFDRLKAGSEAGLAVAEGNRKGEIERLVDDAVAVGKIFPARRDHWKTALATDFEGNKDQLSKLAEGLVPVKERGSAGSSAEGVEAGGQGLPDAWFPEIAASRNRQSGPVVNAREG